MADQAMLLYLSELMLQLGRINAEVVAKAQLTQSNDQRLAQLQAARARLKAMQQQLDQQRRAADQRFSAASAAITAQIGALASTFPSATKSDPAVATGAADAMATATTEIQGLVDRATTMPQEFQALATMLQQQYQQQLQTQQRVIEMQQAALKQTIAKFQ